MQDIRLKLYRLSRTISKAVLAATLVDTESRAFKRTVLMPLSRKSPRLICLCSLLRFTSGQYHLAQRPLLRDCTVLRKRTATRPLGRYEKYPEKDCALLMTAADDYFWTFEQAVSYYNFTLTNYMGFTVKGFCLQEAAMKLTKSRITTRLNI